jgi:hypothetical protein
VSDNAVTADTEDTPAKNERPLAARRNLGIHNICIYMYICIHIYIHIYKYPHRYSCIYTYKYISIQVCE